MNYVNEIQKSNSVHPSTETYRRKKSDNVVESMWVKLKENEGQTRRIVEAIRRIRAVLSK